MDAPYSDNTEIDLGIAMVQARRTNLDSHHGGLRACRRLQSGPLVHISTVTSMQRVNKTFKFSCPGVLQRTTIDAPGQEHVSLGSF